MINFIKSDLYRIFKGKAIYVCIGIIIFISCVSVVLMEPGTIDRSIYRNNRNVGI